MVGVAAMVAIGSACASQTVTVVQANLARDLTYRTECGALTIEPAVVSEDLRYVAFARDFDCRPMGLEVGDLVNDRRVAVFDRNGTPCHSRDTSGDVRFVGRELIWLCAPGSAFDPAQPFVSIYRWSAPFTAPPERQDVWLPFDDTHLVTVASFAVSPDGGQIVVGLIANQPPITRAGTGHVYAIDRQGQLTDHTDEAVPDDSASNWLPALDGLFWTQSGITVFGGEGPSRQLIATRMDPATFEPVESWRLPYAPGRSSAHLSLSSNDMVGVFAGEGAREQPFFDVYDLARRQIIRRFPSEDMGLRRRHGWGEVSPDDQMATWLDQRTCQIEVHRGEQFDSRHTMEFPDRDRDRECGGQVRALTGQRVLINNNVTIAVRSVDD